MERYVRVKRELRLGVVPPGQDPNLAPGTVIDTTAASLHEWTVQGMLDMGQAEAATEADWKAQQKKTERAKAKPSPAEAKPSPAADEESEK